MFNEESLLIAGGQQGYLLTAKLLVIMENRCKTENSNSKA
jgi:hypothetical protein